MLCRFVQRYPISCGRSANPPFPVGLQAPDMIRPFSSRTTLLLFFVMFPVYIKVEASPKKSFEGEASGNRRDDAYYRTTCGLVDWCFHSSLDVGEEAFAYDGDFVVGDSDCFDFVTADETSYRVPVDCEQFGGFVDCDEWFCWLADVHFFVLPFLQRP